MSKELEIRDLDPMQELDPYCSYEVSIKGGEVILNDKIDNAVAPTKEIAETFVRLYNKALTQSEVGEVDMKAVIDIIESFIPEGQFTVDIVSQDIADQLLECGYLSQAQNPAPSVEVLKEGWKDKCRKNPNHDFINFEINVGLSCIDHLQETGRLR